MYHLYEFSIRSWKHGVQSVAHAPVEEVVELGEGGEVVEEVGGRLEHPVHVALLRPPRPGHVPQLHRALRQGTNQRGVLRSRDQHHQLSTNHSSPGGTGSRRSLRRSRAGSCLRWGSSGSRGSPPPGTSPRRTATCRWGRRTPRTRSGCTWSRGQCSVYWQQRLF